MHISYPTLELCLLFLLLFELLTELELFCIELADAHLKFDYPAIEAFTRRVLVLEKPFKLLYLSLLLLVILSVLSGHVLIVTDFLFLEAELLLHFLKCQLYLLEFAIVDSLHLSLLTINAVTGTQPLFQEIKLRAHFCCEVTNQGAILFGSLDLKLHSVEQLL